MTFSEIWQKCFRKTFITTGRASKREFWMFFSILIAFVILYAALILCITPDYIRPSDYLPAKAISTLCQLILTPYSLALYAVTIRRLQDSNHSGWNLLWLFLPFLGWLYLLVLLCRQGCKGPNAYGDEVSDFNS